MLFTKKMAPVVAEEYSQATLEVEVSLESGEVQWMRQGVLIHPGAKYTLKHQGFKHSLTVHKLATSDRGTYSCETLHDRTQARLTVERECARVLTMHCVCFVYHSCRRLRLPLPLCIPSPTPPLLLYSKLSIHRVIRVTRSHCATCSGT